MGARRAETRKMRGSVHDSLAAQRHAKVSLGLDLLLVELTKPLNHDTRSNAWPGFQIR